MLLARLSTRTSKVTLPAFPAPTMNTSRDLTAGASDSARAVERPCTDKNGAARPVQPPVADSTRNPHAHRTNDAHNKSPNWSFCALGQGKPAIERKGRIRQLV